MHGCAPTIVWMWTSSNHRPYRWNMFTPARFLLFLVQMSQKNVPSLKIHWVFSIVMFFMFIFFNVFKISVFKTHICSNCNWVFIDIWYLITGDISRSPQIFYQLWEKMWPPLLSTYQIIATMYIVDSKNKLKTSITRLFIFWQHAEICWCNIWILWCRHTLHQWWGKSDWLLNEFLFINEILTTAFNFLCVFVLLFYSSLTFNFWNYCYILFLI